MKGAPYNLQQTPPGVPALYGLSFSPRWPYNSRSTQVPSLKTELKSLLWPCKSHKRARLWSLLSLVLLSCRLSPFPGLLLPLLE